MQLCFLSRNPIDSLAFCLSDKRVLYFSLKEDDNANTNVFPKYT